MPGDTSAIQRYTQQYHYDELGNILTMSHSATSGSWTRHYHYASNFATNKLLSTSADGEQPTLDHYQYDAHGNMTAMPHLSSMSWDYADRLQSANLGGGGDVYYTYDAGGNRTRKVVDKGNGLVHERIYLGDYEVYRERQNGTVQLERETLHLADDTGRIALVDTQTVENAATISTPAPNIRYQLSNHLGSATVELDDTAAMISYEEYHPFGSTSYRSGSNAAETSLKRYRYVGKERDEETGLYYYGARYYAAWLARFISTDPLKDDYPYYTSYQYAGNKPITFIDLDGLEEAYFDPGTGAIIPASDHLRHTPSEDAIFLNHPVEEDLSGSILAGIFIDTPLAVFNQVSTFITGVSNAFTTYIPQIFGFEGSEPSQVLTSKGFKEFGGYEHSEISRESAQIIGYEVLGAAVGEISGPLLGFFIKKGDEVLFKTLGEFAEDPESLKQIIREFGIGPNGAYLGNKRLDEGVLRQLSEEHGVEFAQVYTADSGVNGGGGFYTLYRGTVSTVDLPLGSDEILINHTHPGGTIFPSEYDIDYLILQEKLGSPQKTSEILPLGKESVIFNRQSDYIDKNGNIITGGK